MRSGATDETGRAEVGANPPGPQGSQTAAAQCVERLARSTAARCAALLLGDSPFANRIVSYLSSGALTFGLDHLVPSDLRGIAEAAPCARYVHH